MGRQLWLALGIGAGVAVAATAWLGTPAVKAWLPGAEAPQPVLLLVVGDRQGLAEVRRAVDPERILSAGPDALVLREGRVVVTDLAAAGAPLTALGWVERPIEIWALGDRRDALQDRKRRSEAAPSLAELARKPTLSLPEALALLDASY